MLCLASTPLLKGETTRVMARSLAAGDAT